MKAVLYDSISISTPFAADALRGRQAVLIDYARKHGIEIVGIYEDIGCSGPMLNSIGTQAVIQAIREGKADTILLMNRDRLNKGTYPEELQNLPVIEVEKERQPEQEAAGYER